MIIIVVVFLFLNRSAGREARNFKRKMTLMIYIGSTVTIVAMLLVTRMPTDYPNQPIQVVPFLCILETLQFATPSAIVTSPVVTICLFVESSCFLSIL